MKKMKKLFAVILSLAMVLGMSLTAFAENNVNEDATRSSSDTVDVTISDLEKGVTVTLYRIAKGQYGESGGEGTFMDYTWAAGLENIKDDNGKNFIEYAKEGKLNSKLVNSVVLGLQNKNVTAIAGTTPDEFATEGKNVTVLSGDAIEYRKSVGAGAYIAVITGGKSVYNPVFLTASYNAEGKLEGGNIGLTNAMYGSDAVAKKTTPKPTKSIISGTEQDENKKTAQIGDVVTYSVVLDMPSFPSNATNKTLFITDTLDAGLTFDYDSLEIILDKTESSNGTSIKISNNQFTLGNDEDAKVIATARKNENGFNINFNYDNLIKEGGSVSVPTIVYRGVINEKAVVGKGDAEGKEGNENKVIMYYPPNPNQGSTHNTPETPTPDEAKDLKQEEDVERVYTYQIAFEKTGKDNVKLAGAVFGIYETGVEGTDTSNGSVSGNPIDVVTTNSNGIAVSTNLSSKEYYIKELAAPSGYSLNEKVYTIKPTWSTATKKVTSIVTDKTYTSDPNKALASCKNQVGWLRGNVFYEMSAYTADDKEKYTDLKEAYLSGESTTTSSVTTTEFNTNFDGGGTIKLENAIPNTQLTSLPSTGGIGTTIFTIGGCAIMIIAAALFFASRRKAAK